MNLDSRLWFNIDHGSINCERCKGPLIIMKITFSVNALLSELGNHVCEEVYV